MKSVSILAAVAAATIASPGVAHHADHLGIPYPTRGACEAESAQLRNGDREFLLDLAPQYFQTVGDVNSFLSRAFTCDLDNADGQWYFTDHRVEVLDSDWFLRRP